MPGKITPLTIAVCAALLLLAGGPAQAGIDEWTPIGPFGGPPGTLAIDPITAGTIYAGGRGGVFKSTDGGDSWAAARDGLPTDVRVQDLAIDPQDPATVFAAVGTDGVYKSTDAGASWSAAREGLPSAYVLAIDPQSPDTLYAGRFGGVYKSTDGGANWAAVNGGLAADVSIMALAIDPQNPDTLYAGTFTGLFRSTDGGANWSIADRGLALAAIWDLAIDPQNPQTLYAGGFEFPPINGTRVFKSTDGADNWSPTTVTTFSSSTVSLAIDAQDPQTLFAAVPLEGSHATYGYFRSTDGGDGWNLVQIAPGTSDLAIAPRVSGTVYAATNEGAWRSTDAGASWNTVNDGLANTSAEAMVIDPQDPDTLYAGTLEGVFRSADAGDSWAAASEGIPNIVFFKTLVVDPVDPTNLYALIGGTFTDIIFDLVLRSTNAGASWSIVQNGLPEYPYLEALAIDPQRPRTLYLGGGPGGVFKTTDGGNMWFPANQGIEDLGVSALAIDPLTPATVYAAGHTGLFKSTDAGVSWQDVSAGLPVGGNPEINLLAIDPQTPEILYAHGRFGLARSTDGGSGWVLAGDGLSGEIDALAIDPQNPTTLYAGGSEGVFRSLDRGGSWATLNQGLAVTAVTSLAVDPSDASTVYAGTRGGGVFSIRLLGEQTVLELQGGRFRVEVDWRDFQGATGPGTVAVVGGEEDTETALRSSDSTVTRFFSPDNWEMLAKVLDGRVFNQHFWVFLSAATDVELTTTVTDTSCGTVRTYVNPLGQAAPAVTDVFAFPDCAQPSPPACVEGPGAVCLGAEGRFRVETTWRDFAGATGPGNQVTIPGAGLARSADSGLFYFFSRDNWELLVKVLDGCGINERFWVFAAATTDVEYTLTVTDTETDQVRTYTNPLGQAADAITDTEAFATCPP
ncbi:MAG: hypothetical protein GY719_04790 [bacterium]|nr:hypothetical protein [bacterium]